MDTRLGLFSQHRTSLPRTDSCFQCHYISPLPNDISRSLIKRIPSSLSFPEPFSPGSKHRKCCSTTLDIYYKNFLQIKRESEPEKGGNAYIKLLSHHDAFLWHYSCFYNWSSSKGFHLLASVSSVLMTHDEGSFLSA